MIQHKSTLKTLKILLLLLYYFVLRINKTVFLTARTVKCAALNQNPHGTLMDPIIN